MAPGHNRRHADAGVQQAQQQIALPSRAYGREHPAAAEFRRTWVFRHAPHDFVVLIQPDQVIRIERAPARHEQRPQFGSFRCVDGIARRVHVAVGIGSVRQQQLHHLAVTECARRHVGTRPGGRRLRANWDRPRDPAADVRSRGGRI